MDVHHVPYSGNRCEIRLALSFFLRLSIRLALFYVFFLTTLLFDLLLKSKTTKNYLNDFFINSELLLKTLTNFDKFAFISDGLNLLTSQ